MIKDEAAALSLAHIHVQVQQGHSLLLWRDLAVAVVLRQLTQTGLVAPASPQIQLRPISLQFALQGFEQLLFLLLLLV